jgi:hypothetical protein
MSICLCLCYKPIMIVNEDSSVVNKLETSSIDDTRVVIYNRHMFIVLGLYSQHFIFILTYKLAQ